MKEVIEQAYIIISFKTTIYLEERLGGRKRSKIIMLLLGGRIMGNFFLSVLCVQKSVATYDLIGCALHNSRSPICPSAHLQLIQPPSLATASKTHAYYSCVTK